jgi:hypothetical protein
MANRHIQENRESWETLQKGQIAELAFERIALASGYAVRYTGRQYTELLEPSAYRAARPASESPWRPDFELLRREGDGWAPHAVVEVKWRAKGSTVTSVPPRTTHLVLFDPEGLRIGLAAEGRVGPLQSFKDETDLRLCQAAAAEIFEATQALLAVFDGG